MQASEAQVAERERAADEATQAGHELQEENAQAAAGLEARSAAISGATEDLRALKNEVDALIRAIGAGVAEAGESEARAHATWALLRDHVGAVAAGEGLDAEDVATPPFVVRAPDLCAAFVVPLLVKRVAVAHR